MIERAGLDCANDILQVINISNRERYQSITPQEYFQDPYLSLAELLQNFDTMAFYIYKHQDKIVGVVALEIENPEVGKIHYLYVLPPYQREGIGAALVSYLQRVARGMGLKKLKLHVGEKAYWAVNFYKNLGYDAVDRLEPSWGTTIVMAKEL